MSKITKITFEYEGSQSTMFLEGDDAQHFMDRHDKAMKLACLAGMSEEAMAAIAETGNLTKIEAEPMKPEIPNFKLDLHLV